MNITPKKLTRTKNPTLAASLNGAPARVTFATSGESTAYVTKTLDDLQPEENGTVEINEVSDVNWNNFAEKYILVCVKPKRFISLCLSLVDRLVACAVQWMSNTKLLKFHPGGGKLAPSDPHRNPTIMLDHLPHPKAVPYAALQPKLAPCVTKEVYKHAIETLNPSPTDSIPLVLKQSGAFVKEAYTIASELGITPVIITRGRVKGKGIYSVGQAAAHQPALVIFSHRPPGAKRYIAWVEKGIVFDTGGLSIKTKETMPDMKRAEN
ncbi:unnamed protein product [Orchesella dallaii]|uniref:Cytosol aminopeptidase domain-containing protein n=1 Tax=Orchesella dallaii TaxID=48710 RepID=A0ABP1QE07_9HEXA